MKMFSLKLLKYSFFISVFSLFYSPKIFSQTYLSENFNGNSIPAGWTVTNGGVGDCQWMIHAPYTNAGTPITMAESNFLFVNSDSGGSGTVANEIITSPAMNTMPGQVSFLEFQHYYRAGGILRLDTGSVEVFNGTSWVRVGAYFTNQGLGNNPTTVKINVTQYKNANFRVRFRYVGNWAYYWAIDNVKVSTPADNDIGVVSILSSTGNCGLPSSFPVTVRVANFGSQTQTQIPVQYQVNNGIPVSEVFNGVLAPGDTANYTFVTPFVAPSQGQFGFRAWTFLNADGDLSNDSSNILTLTRRPSGFAPVTFTGFTGANLTTLFPGWYEAAGLNPTGTTSAWLNNAAAQQTAFGTTTAKVNLFTATKKEWIISPPVNPVANSALRYKVALTNWNTPAIDSMGTDDSLIVKISTNCGQTWSRLKTYTKANPPTNQLTLETIPLAPYEGQTVIIGFYATEGTVDDPNDYDVHIDDPEIFVQSPNDLSVVSILNVDGNCGVGNSMTVQVRVYNNGTQSQSSIPIAYRVNNQAPVQQTFAQNLAPSEYVNLTFSTPANFPNPGNYSLSAWSELATDANIQNDSIVNVPLFKPGSGFNAIEFTGFTGANLATVHPGWVEAVGLNATGTTSAWTSSAAAQTTGFGTTTARVNLFGSTKKEWIISQPIIPNANAALRFKLAVTNFGTVASDLMGADDSLVVKVSTNCGQTWSRIASYTRADNLTNTLTFFMVPLTSFANQNIRIGFYATEGVVDNPEDYDLHIDAIEVYVPSPHDLAMQTMILPNSSCGVGASFDLKVRVMNNGTENQSLIPLAYSVNGQTPVEYTFNQTLFPGETGEFTFPAPINFPTAGSYALKAWTKLGLDINFQNDTVKATVSRPGNNFSPVTFTGFTGANLGTVFPGWREAIGLAATGTTSAWTSSLTIQTNALGSVTSKVNLYTNTRKEWMISPAFVPSAGHVLTLKLAVTSFGGIATANMGSDDSLIVKISTDCGNTWVRERFWTAASNLTNQLTEYIVPLANFVNQNIIIGIYATDGATDNPQDYDLHVDDLQIILPLADDVGIGDILFPSGNCGAPATVVMSVKVTNFGTAAQSNIPVFYSMNGQTPVSQTVPGPIAAGASLTFNFPQAVDLSNPGVYSFSAWTSLPNDGNISNDSVLDRILVRPENYMILQDFNSFNGTNLESLYPGWYEATGQLAVPNPSSWANCTGSQTTALQSQTSKINMNAAVKREWIISPVVSPLSESNLHFKVAVTSRNFGLPATMGSDDSVNVMVTTNCGQSWIRLQAFTAASNLTNQLQNKVIPLGAYANQPIRIGFFATEGTINNPEDFDFHLDDVFVSISTETQPIISNGKISLYPNPANHKVTVQLPQNARSGDAIRLVGLDGREVGTPVSLTEGFDNLEISLETLPAGYYFMKVSIGGKVLVEPLVIRK